MFFDKDYALLDKQVQSLNERLEAIQRGYTKEEKYIRTTAKAYENYDAEINKRVAELLKQEGKWTQIGTVVGAAVGALALWQLFQGGKTLLRWIGDKMAQRDAYEDETRRSRQRVHARHWNVDEL